jgi:hypothetical protein
VLHAYPASCGSGTDVRLIHFMDLIFDNSIGQLDTSNDVLTRHQLKSYLYEILRFATEIADSWKRKVWLLGNVETWALSGLPTGSLSCAHPGCFQRPPREVIISPSHRGLMRKYKVLWWVHMVRPLKICNYCQILGHLRQLPISKQWN